MAERRGDDRLAENQRLIIEMMNELKRSQAENVQRLERNQVENVGRLESRIDATETRLRAYMKEEIDRLEQRIDPVIQQVRGNGHPEESHHVKIYELEKQLREMRMRRKASIKSSWEFWTAVVVAALATGASIVQAVFN